MKCFWNKIFLCAACFFLCQEIPKLDDDRPMQNKFWNAIYIYVSHIYALKCISSQKKYELKENISEKEELNYFYTFDYTQVFKLQIDR